MAVERSFELGQLHGQVNGRFGSVIINLLTYIPYRLFSNSNSAELSIILTNMFFASLCVVVIFLLINEIFANKRIAFFSAFLYGISPMFLSVTTYGKPQGIEAFFIFLSILLLQYFHKQNSFVKLMASSVMIAFAVTVRESAIIFVPIYFLFYLHPYITAKPPYIKFSKNTFMLRNVFGAALPFVVILSISAYFYLYRVLFKTLFEDNTAIVSYLGLFSKKLPFATQDLLFQVSSLGMVCAVAGVVLLFKRTENKFYGIFFLIWMLSFFYFGNTSNYKPRYLMITSFPFFLFMGHALYALFEKKRVLGNIVFLAVFFLLFGSIHPLIFFRKDFSGEKAFALWLKTQVPKNSSIIAVDDSPFIQYYANLKTEYYPINNPEKLTKWIDTKKQEVKEGLPIYIVGASFIYDRKDIFRRALNNNFSFLYIGSHPIEDYHGASIKFTYYVSHLYKLVSKSPKKD